MRRYPPLIAGIALALSTTYAVAQFQDIVWDMRGGAALRTLVQPGNFVEWCGPLHVGDDVHWEFESGDPLESNVHYHEGNTVNYPVPPAMGQMRSGRLLPSAEQAHCWMWTNRGAKPVALQARLQKIARALNGINRR